MVMKVRFYFWQQTKVQKKTFFELSFWEVMNCGFVELFMIDVH